MKTTLLSIVSLLAISAHAGDTIYLQNQTIRTNQAMGFKAQPGTKFYIIQFGGPVTDQLKKQLRDGGVELGSYVPDDAFIVKMTDAKAWSTINSLSSVRQIVPFRSQYKVSQDFAPLSVFNQQNLETVLVRLFSADELNSVLNALDAQGAQVATRKVYGSVIQVTAPRSVVAQIQNIEGVEWVEPMPTLETFTFDAGSKTVTSTGKGDYSDMTGYETGGKLINADVAWSRGFTGSGEVVGIGDTGLDMGTLGKMHADFEGQIAAGYALGKFAKSWDDTMGHGTHVAGSVAGLGMVSNGLIKGTAYDAKLAISSIWSPMLGNLNVPPQLADLFLPSYKKDGARVHTNSWGSANIRYDNMCSMADEVMFDYPDYLILFAAGNSGVDKNKDGRIDESSVASPGNAKNVLTVGASENLVLNMGKQRTCGEARPDSWGVEPIASSKLSDNPDGMACFSSVGPTPDGRIKPDIVAPGTNILSTQSQAPGASNLWGSYNQYYSMSGGTSMATPITAGAAAVTRQYVKSLGVANPSSALIKAVMIHTAHDLFPGQYPLGPQQEYPTERPNSVEGYGRVDLQKVTEITPDSLIDETVGLKTTESKTYDIEVAEGGNLEVTMVYNDAPATPAARKALVNDLDLVIMNPEGGSHFPNHLTRPDTANNTENIKLVGVPAGIYRVVVTGRNIPQGAQGTGAQPYALIVTK